MKKRLVAFILATMTTITLIGCTSHDNATQDVMKVGMVTDAGTIDDKSFNQGTWEGINAATDELNVKATYMKPNGQSDEEFLTEISNLYDSGFNFIVTPGYKFEGAIYSAQDKYSDAKFVLIDGTPNDGNGNSKVGDNTVSIYFMEHEAGFLAGFATALKIQEGQVGFIGGVEVPAVQKYNWGFQQGILYANENFNTRIEMNKENFLYQGTFDNSAAGQQIAASMYDKNVKAIFVAAGTTGIGAINEAKARASKGEDVWTIGVDVDQYSDGIYQDNKSVMLTSAMKKLSQASFDMISKELNKSFPGGETIMFDIKNDGVGLPTENPNLTSDIEHRVNEIREKIKNGEIKVDSEQGELL